MSALPISEPVSAPAGAIITLLVSPNGRLRRELREKIVPPRWMLVEAQSGAEAFEYLHDSRVDLLLLDPMLPDLESTEFSSMVLERFPETQVLTLNTHTGQLVLGSTSPTPLATELSSLLHPQPSAPVPSWPVPPPALQSVMSARGGPDPGLPNVIGGSDAMRRVSELTRMVAQRDTTVLVTGESGTGKDLIAQAVHLLSPRHRHPLVVINCAAIPEALLEAELFGYTKGSFTGAVQSRIGRIHAAHGGTLFLDEIGDMPLSLQSKILRFLEQGEVQRIGGNDNLKVDVRVVAATNAALPQMVQQKLFREDLYFRLAIFPIRLPPLRERFGDVPRLAATFLARFAPHATLTEEALAMLRTHPWPGNVRELRNVMERASILLGNERELRGEHVVL
ncbi:sigma-54 interaction domain-containing protein [Bryocella elongata]|nr:sigma 54-interacting transcriptional regulator [Bryocella elongata]